MRKTILRTVGISFAVLIMISMLTIIAFGSSYWQVKNDRFSGTAGETLTNGQVVCIKASDNKIYKADADDATLRPAVGFIGKGGAANSTVEVVTDGVLAGAPNATPGERIYLSTTAGNVTTSGGANVQVLGYGLPGTTANVTTTYKIHIDLGSNTVLGY